MEGGRSGSIRTMFSFSCQKFLSCAEKANLKDLGVRISSDLTFTDQIDLAVASGSRMAGWALQTFRGRGGA